MSTGLAASFVASGVLALVLACDGGKPAPRSTAIEVTRPGLTVGSQPGTSDAARTWPTDAPSPAAPCQRHADCAMIVWDGPMPPDPCCDQRVGYLPVHAAYLAWMTDYRARHCQGARCPDAPLPGAEPACCAVIARCVSGTCKPACEDAAAGVPDVSSLDARCQAARLAP